MSPETAQSNNEFKKSTIFLAARAKVEEMIRAQIKDVALQNEMIAELADELAELLAQARQEAWEELARAKLAEAERNRNAQPIEGFLPEQLNSVNPIVAKSMEDIEHHYQQFQTAKTTFATAQTQMAPQLSQINSAVTAMQAALAPALAPSAPVPTPTERKKYEKDAVVLAGYARKLHSYASLMDTHIEQVETHAKAIGAQWGFIQSHNPRKADLQRAQFVFEEVSSHLTQVKTQKQQLTNTIALTESTYKDFVRIAKRGFNVDLASYSEFSFDVDVAPDYDLSSSPLILLKAPRPGLGGSSCRDEEREQDESGNSLFSGYAPTIK